MDPVRCIPGSRCTQQILDGSELFARCNHHSFPGLRSPRRGYLPGKLERSCLLSSRGGQLISDCKRRFNAAERMKNAPWTGRYRVGFTEVTGPDWYFGWRSTRSEAVAEFVPETGQ